MPAFQLLCIDCIVVSWSPDLGMLAEKLETCNKSSPRSRVAVSCSATHRSAMDNNTADSKLPSLPYWPPPYRSIAADYEQLRQHPLGLRLKDALAPCLDGASKQYNAGGGDPPAAVHAALSLDDDANVVKHQDEDQQTTLASRGDERGQNSRDVGLPSDVAKMNEVHAFLLRHSWKRGKHPDLVARSQAANSIIRSINRRAGRDQNMYCFPGANVMELIDYLKAVLEVWHSTRSDFQEDRQMWAAEQVAITVLSIRVLIDRVDIRWKAIVPYEVTSLCRLALEQTRPGAETGKLLQRYFDEDVIKPTYSQLELVKKAAKYTREEFNRPAIRRPRDVYSFLLTLEMIDERLQNVNQSLLFNKHDHQLPIGALVAVRMEDTAPRRSQLATMCTHFGFQPLAEAISEQCGLENGMFNDANDAATFRANIQKTIGMLENPIDAELDMEAYTLLDLSVGLLSELSSSEGKGCRETEIGTRALQPSNDSQPKNPYDIEENILTAEVFEHVSSTSMSSPRSDSTRQAEDVVESVRVAGPLEVRGSKDEAGSCEREPARIPNHASEAEIAGATNERVFSSNNENDTTRQTIDAVQLPTIAAVPEHATVVPVTLESLLAVRKDMSDTAGEQVSSTNNDTQFTQQTLDPDHLPTAAAAPGHDTVAPFPLDPALSIRRNLSGTPGELPKSKLLYHTEIRLNELLLQCQLYKQGDSTDIPKRLSDYRRLTLRLNSIQISLITMETDNVVEARRSELLKVVEKELKDINAASRPAESKDQHSDDDSSHRLNTRDTTSLSPASSVFTLSFPSGSSSPQGSKMHTDGGSKMVETDIIPTSINKIHSKHDTTSLSPASSVFTLSFPTDGHMTEGSKMHTDGATKPLITDTSPKSCDNINGSLSMPEHVPYVSDIISGKSTQNWRPDNMQMRTKLAHSSERSSLSISITKGTGLMLRNEAPTPKQCSCLFTPAFESVKCEFCQGCLGLGDLTIEEKTSVSGFFTTMERLGYKVPSKDDSAMGGYA